MLMIISHYLQKVDAIYVLLVVFLGVSSKKHTSPRLAVSRILRISIHYPQLLRIFSRTGALAIFPNLVLALYYRYLEIKDFPLQSSLTGITESSAP